MDNVIKFKLVEEMKKRFNESPYYKLLGLKVTDIGEGISKVEMDWKSDLVNLLGTVHGGAITSLADSAGAIASCSLLSPGQLLTTIELKINFLMPFNSGKLIAIGNAIYKGSKITVSDVELKNEDGKLVAKAIVTCMILN